MFKQLKNNPHVEQVAFFGDQLHISGKNEEQLLTSIAPFRDQFNWQKIKPSLEDVFINLVKKNEHD